MRLILPRSLLHWKKQLPVGGVQLYSQMSRSKSQQFSQLSIVLGLQENCELLQEVETTMVSSSYSRMTVSEISYLEAISRGRGSEA